MRISSESSNFVVPGIDNGAELRASMSSANMPLAALDSAAQNKVSGNEGELQKTFQDFVGQTFFGQMIASMRATQEETPYFNGGRAEKIFQGQLDQVLAEELSDSSAEQFADPMFKLFQLQRK